MLKVASCDSQGAVYISNDAVYRLVDSNHKNSVSGVLKTINTSNIEGVVQTELCSDKEIINSIDSAGNGLILKHNKIRFISYPHEWCASMLKDAALFHLDLSQQIFEQGLFLKDAHPWNILFEKGRPVFIDFTSIVSSDSLLAEEYLESNKLHRSEGSETRLAWVLKEILERMYLPYFIYPLSAYAFGQREHVRKLIENTTLNSSTSIISLRECMPKLRFGRSTIKKLFGLVKHRLILNKLIKRLTIKKRISDFYQDMHRYVSNTKVAIGSSAYSSYYGQKGEDQDNVYSEQWNDKQKAVYNALNVDEVNSVLDVACNTGWFAIMAEKLGKHVVAFDIDEGCIENLYNQVKDEQLDILPLVMNFTELTQDRYSIYDGKKVLINASERLRSDSVIALGIIHHLILGLGLTFEEVLDRLIPLCEKQLVIEFIDASDSMIQNEPSFFLAYYQNKEILSGYELEKLIALCEERGFEVRCETSHPATRTILVCSKVPTA